MSNISASDVASLRARTGVSIMAVKQALEEAGGDQEKAIEILRKKGIAGAVKKADREQREGAIFVASSGNKAALVLIRCETDFVSRSDDFQAFGQKLADTVLASGVAGAQGTIDTLIPEAVQKLGENISLGDAKEISAPSVGTYVHSNRKIGVMIGLGAAGKEDVAKDVAMHAAAMNPSYVQPEDVSAEAVAKEREIWQEQMKGDTKPAEIQEKIMQGKEKKFREENALLTQAFVKDSGKTVQQFLSGTTVTEYVRVTV